MSFIEVPSRVLNKASSVTIQNPQDTIVGRMVSSLSTQHKKSSGFVLLNKGVKGLAWRTMGADVAEKSIDAQYYLWKNDSIGKIFMQYLLAAADRGVRVRILLDDAVTVSDPKYLANFAAHPMVSVRIYRPFGPKYKSSVLRWFDFLGNFKQLDRRMHNKMYIVDGSLAILGGRNIGDEYFDYPVSYVFRNRDLAAIGPVVSQASRVFDMYWNSSWAVPVAQVVAHQPTADEFSNFRRLIQQFAVVKSNYPAKFFEQQKIIQPHRLKDDKQFIWAPSQLLFDTIPGEKGQSQQPDDLYFVGTQLAKMALSSTREILIESAYFVPAEQDIDMLQKLHDKNVKVKILTNSLSSTNHIAAFAGYKRQRLNILRAGVELYEMQTYAKNERQYFGHISGATKKMTYGIHDKSAVFDASTIFVGSFNFDQRSEKLNTEIGLLVHSSELARQLQEHIINDMTAGNAWHVQEIKNALGQQGTKKLMWQNGADDIITAPEPQASCWRKFACFWMNIFIPSAEL